jgi:hypothetical protein
MDWIAWVRKVQHALHECAESIRRSEERKRKKHMPVDKTTEVRAVVSFDDKTVRDSQAQAKEDRDIQKSIKNAAWSAFIAASIYAFIAAYQGCQMYRATQATEEAARTATDTLHIAYRPRVAIDGITNQGLEDSGYRITFNAPNFGNVEARNVRFFTFHSIGKREDVKRLSYEELPDEPKLMLPRGREGDGHAIFVRLADADQQRFKNGELMTVSIKIEYEGEFPNIVHHAETCAIFPLKGDQGACPWAVQND